MRFTWDTVKLLCLSHGIGNILTLSSPPFFIRFDTYAIRSVTWDGSSLQHSVQATNGGGKTRSLLLGKAEEGACDFPASSFLDSSGSWLEAGLQRSRSIKLEGVRKFVILQSWCCCYCCFYWYAIVLVLVVRNNAKESRRASKFIYHAVHSGRN